MLKRTICFIKTRASASRIARACIIFIRKFTTNREKKYSLWYTVEPRYLELGYLELPAISNLNPFPLDFPLLFQSFILSYLELGYLANSRLSRTYTHFPWICPCFFSHSYSVISNSVIANSPLSRTIFCSPSGPNQPRLSRTLMTKLINKRQNVSEHSWEVYYKDIKPLILHINSD